MTLSRSGDAGSAWWAADTSEAPRRRRGSLAARLTKEAFATAGGRAYRRPWRATSPLWRDEDDQ